MVTAIVGANWGDEGKGKITDLLASESDIVIRFQGGANAGHTIINDHGRFALHLMPSGVCYDNIVNIIGNGVALDICTAFRCGDIVSVCIYSLLIGVIVLESDLYEVISLLCSKVDRRCIDSFLMSVQILNEGDDTAVIMEVLLDRFSASVISKIDRNFLVKESHLTVTCDH